MANKKEEFNPLDDFFSGDGLDIGSGKYQPMPVDDYAGEIKEYKLQTSKSGWMAHLTIEIIGDKNYEGRKIWDNAIIEGTKHDMWRIRQIILSAEKSSPGASAAIGLPPHYDSGEGQATVPYDDDGNLIWDDVSEWLDRLIGRQVTFRTKITTYNGVKKAEIFKYYFDAPSK